MAKERLIQFIKISISLVLIIWLANSGHLEFSAIKVILAPKYLFLCLGLTMLTLLLNHYRWWLLLNSKGFTFKYWKSFSVTLFGCFMSFAMPGSVGGDVLKMYFLAKENKNKKLDGGTTIVIDRVLGLFTMVSLSFLAMFFNIEIVMSNLVLKSFFIGLFIAFIVTIILMVSFFISGSLIFDSLKKVQEHKNKFIRIAAKTVLSLKSYKEQPKVILAAICISVFSQLATVLFFYIVGDALGEQLAFQTYIFAVFLGFMVMAVPLSPGGIGVGQVAFLFFFKAATGLDLKVGAIGVTINQLILFLFGALGFLVFIKSYKFKSSDLKAAV